MSDVDPPFSLEKLVARIHLALAELDKKPEWLAAASGVNKGMISQLMSGKRKLPALQTIVRISEALGARLEWLVYGTGEMWGPSPPPHGRDRGIETTGPPR